jgi:hypothetical protein
LPKQRKVFYFFITQLLCDLCVSAVKTLFMMGAS